MLGFWAYPSNGWIFWSGARCVRRGCSECDHEPVSADNSKPSAPGRPFAAGQSGNPGGKSPEREALRRYIVDTYGKESIDGIAALATEARSEKVRLDARVWLAEQSVGRALVAVAGEDGKPIKIDVDLLGTLKRLAETVGG